MGFAFPLANALVQDAESSIGRQAGSLYLANTLGAVGGSLVTGLFLIPRIGTQAAASLLICVAALSALTVFFAADRSARSTPLLVGALSASSTEPTSHSLHCHHRKMRMSRGCCCASPER